MHRLMKELCDTSDMASCIRLLLVVLGVLQVVNCYYNGRQIHRQDHYGSYWKKKEIKEIPTAGSLDPRVNLGKISVRGDYLFSDLVKESGHTVYKINLFEERVILADPIAIRAMHDPRLIERNLDLGLFTYNADAFRGYVSSANSNGDEHLIKKRGQYRILKRALQKHHGYDGMFKILQKHFTDILPAIANDQVNVETLIDVVALKTLTEFFLGKEYGDLRTYLTWFSSSLTLKGTPPAAATANLTNKIFQYLESTPFVIEDLKEIQKSDRRNLETLKSEAVFFVFVFVTFATRSVMSSAIPLYLNLDKEDSDKIIAEAEEFLKDDGLSIEEKMRNLDIIDRFALEVFRYLTPVRGSFGVAKKDFVVESLLGNFQIRRGQLITSSNYAAQRNPKTFRLPKTFTTTGDEYHIKDNFIAFGGPYNQIPRFSNRKCLGQDVSLNMVKFFVILFARCDIVPVSDIKFTEKDGIRPVASDEPLKVSKFTCP